MNLKELLIDNGEIEFIYNKCHYVIGRFSNRTINKNKKIVYCLMMDDKIQKFYDINSLLYCKIDEKYLNDILNEVNIV